MRLGVLGAVIVESDDQVLTIRRRRERGLLGILAIQAEHAVSTDRLIHLLWDGEPPPRARAALQSHVSRVRGILHAAGGARHDATVERAGDGYLLRPGTASLDLVRFRHLVAASQQTGDPRALEHELDEALRLWRGAALQDAAGERMREQVCAQLTEERLDALEDLLAVRLSLSREREVLAEVGPLARAHPHRVRLVELQMRALHLTRRTSEALAVFSAARQRFAKELSLEPDPELTRLHRSLLRQEPLPSLLPPGARHPAAAGGMPDSRGGPPADRTTESDGATTAPTTPASFAAPAVPRQLPAAVGDFVARPAELRRLDAAVFRDGRLSSGSLTAVVGIAGGGKSALVTHWAHRRAGRFPGGQLYLDARGSDPTRPALTTTEALSALLGSLQVPGPYPPQADALAALYRTQLAGRRLLLVLVLDDVSTEAQVRPLLPGAPGSAVVVTSRGQLSGLRAAEGAAVLPLGPLTADDGSVLLSRRIDSHRARAEPEQLRAIAARCGNLPLALAAVVRLAAAQPHLALREIAAELDGPNPLDLLSGGDPRVDVRAALTASYQRLSGGAAYLLRQLGLTGGSAFSLSAVASSAGLPPGLLSGVLGELVGCHLLRATARHRYACHPLVLAYARHLAERVDSAEQRAAVRQRYLEHYVHSARAACALLAVQSHPPVRSEPGRGVRPEPLTSRGEALSWLHGEEHALLLAARWSAAKGDDEYTVALTQALTSHLDHPGFFENRTEPAPGSGQGA